MSKPTTRQRMEQLLHDTVPRHYCGALVYENPEGVSDPMYAHEDVLELLLKEHRRLRAKVRDLRQCGFHVWSDNPDFIAGYEQACEDILKVLR